MSPVTITDHPVSALAQCWHLHIADPKGESLPFLVARDGRVGEQNAIRGQVVAVLGFSRRPVTRRIDLTWADYVRGPASRVVRWFPVVMDDKGARVTLSSSPVTEVRVTVEQPPHLPEQIPLMALGEVAPVTRDVQAMMEVQERGVFGQVVKRRQPAHLADLVRRLHL